MAKLVLPHPDKDFVPLSPLTAQELDEMVANNKAVADFANGLATGKNIDDGSIEPNKLSPETFRIKAGPETLTPYRWVNGEEIYQVYTSFNTASHPDNFEQIAEISNMPPASDIKSIVSVEGGLMVSGTDDFWPVGYRNRIAPNNQDFEVKISKVGSKWQARYFTGGAGVANLVIRYVKK